MKKILLFPIMTILILSGCSRNLQKLTMPSLTDGQYDTEFPYNNCSEDLAEICKSICLISSVAYYESYVFPPNSHFIKTDFSPQFIKENAIEFKKYHRTASGTATVIHRYHDTVALLTCAHIVDFPDTVFSYFYTARGTKTPYISSISNKVKQDNYATAIPEGGSVDILLQDKRNDVAILGKKLKSAEHIIPVFTFPNGHAKRLQWGSYTYLLGFPRGYKMISNGIVSLQPHNHSGNFLINAPFNRGFSGGIVLAIKDGVPNFELVGMAKSTAAEYNYILTPPKNISYSEFEPENIYSGDIVLQNQANIQYGITHVIPVETIINIIKNNNKSLLKKGYDLSSFVK